MATQGINPAYLVDPSLYGDQQSIDQQRQLAQLLMTQGLTPMSGTESVGGVAIRRSPLEGVAKLASLLSGQDIQGQANLANQGLMQRQSQAMGSLFGIEPQGVQQTQGQPSPQALGAALGGQPQPTQPGAPLPAAGIGGGTFARAAGSQGLGDDNATLNKIVALVNQGMSPEAAAAAVKQRGSARFAMLGLPGMSPQQAYVNYAMNPDKFMDAQLKGYTPNDTTIAAQQGGVDPQMANRLKLIKESTDPKILAMQQSGMGPMQIYQAVFGNAAKEAEISRRPGEGYSNGLTGEAGMVGKIPEGANVTGPPGPNGQVSLTGMPGNTGVVTGNAAAHGAGNAENEMVEFKLPDGTSMNMTKKQAIQLTRATMPAQAATTPDSLDEQIRAVRSNGGQPIAPADQPAIDREVARLTKQKGALPGFQSGQTTTGAAAAQKGGALPQETLEARFAQLRDANGQAETTNSYLQNIKQLADTAATGKFTDRLQFVNSLLAQAGNEKATDATTANNLLDKYSNQIVARLGQGGLGTDAARSILQSAYPNSTMTPAAIREAADNLMGANAMIQAKTRILSPLATARDAGGYQAKEQAFDQNADPRIWQFATMLKNDPQGAAAFAAKVKAQDPGFSDRIRALQKMGAL